MLNGLNHFLKVCPPTAFIVYLGDDLGYEIQGALDFDEGSVIIVTNTLAR